MLVRNRTFGELIPITILFTFARPLVKGNSDHASPGKGKLCQLRRRLGLWNRIELLERSCEGEPSALRPTPTNLEVHRGVLILRRQSAAFHDLGKRLRTEREHLRLSLRQVQDLSRDIATQRKNSQYYIAHSSLADFESGKQVPSIYKLYTLSVIYRRQYEELAALFRCAGGRSTKGSQDSDFSADRLGRCSLGIQRGGRSCHPGNSGTGWGLSGRTSYRKSSSVGRMFLQHHCGRSTGATPFTATSAWKITRSIPIIRPGSFRTDRLPPENDPSRKLARRF